jgi:hypothetical protein
MSLSSILIFRDLPIINGFVQLPPCRETEKTKITAEDAIVLVADSKITRLSLGSGKLRGSKSGQQEFMRLPAITPNTWYNTDPVVTLGGNQE